MPKPRTKIADTEVNTEGLHTKYRPRDLKDVLGQDAVVKSLRATLKARARPQVFLFTGPAGTGKTTLARIVAAEFGVAGAGIVEVDAASKSGIDDMREVTSALRYNGFGEGGKKAIIINECQGLSKAAWDSLLTTTEEPPPHVFFFFTSTAPAKIPTAMVTRAQAYHLQPVRRDDLLDVLEGVCDDEGLDIDDKILAEVAQAAGGSVRAALTGLAKVQGAETLQEARELLQAPDENGEIIDLCRMMMKGGLSWGKVTAALKTVEGTPAESIRIVVTAYMSKVAIGAKGSEVGRTLDVLEAFSRPCNTTDGLAPVLLAFGRFLDV